ncbi:hypothetical protein ACFSJ3_03320 [Corallincola platygyrae]|uniref:Uncharacterized protein n=1 Tax=Corallincola platygyrae TaxID=1193278 RepID=A0ABW4XLX6_9GAMM
MTLLLFEVEARKHWSLAALGAFSPRCDLIENHVSLTRKALLFLTTSPQTHMMISLPHY